MLDEYTIEMLPEAIYQRLNKINAEYLDIIATKINEIGRLRATDINRLQAMYENGGSIDKITRKLADASGKNVEDIYRIYDLVAKENYEYAKPFYAAKNMPFIPYEQNEKLQKYVRSIAAQTASEYVNLTQHTGFAIFSPGGKSIAPTFANNADKVATSLSDTYTKVLDLAVTKAQLGETDYRSAMREVIKAMSDSGIRSIDYATGYTRRLDSAARQNVLWGIKQCNQNTADIIGTEFGADGYEISYHSNPRPSHADMGGRQYAIGEAKRINGVYYPSFVTVEPLLSDFGCLHFKFSIVLGVSSPTYSKEQLAALKERDKQTFEYEGKEYSGYEATQVQRKLETAIRRQKERANMAKAAGDDTLRREAQQKINQLTAKYKDFSDKSGLPTKMERAQMSGFRKVKTNDELKKTVANGEKSGIIRNYNSGLAKNIEKKHYDAMHDLIDSCTDSDLAAVWEFYESKISVGDANCNEREYCQGNRIYINIESDAKGSCWRSPYQVTFHESGHAIDYLTRDCGNSESIFARHYSSAYENGKFPKTIKQEVADWVSEVDKRLKAEFKEHKDDFEWLHKNGFISDSNWDFFQRYGTWISGEPKYSKSFAYKAIEKEIRELSPKAKADLSDILEGATNGKISAGFGHGSSYWSKRRNAGIDDGLATEAFAEMIDSTMASPESLKTIKKYLPKSYGVFQEMVQALAKKG